MSMKLENPLEMLGPSEVEVINNASAFLNLGIPASDLEVEVLMYKAAALSHQDLVSNLKSMVDYTKSRFYGQVARIEQESLEDLRHDYDKVADRNRALWMEKKYVDIKAQYDALSAVSERLKSMGWSLTHALEAVS